MEEFSEKLRETRRELNLSQKELSNMVCVSDKTIYRWETGESSPSIKQKEAIAECLGLRKDYFYNSFELKNVHHEHTEAKNCIPTTKFKKVWTIILSVFFAVLFLGHIVLYVYHRILITNLSIHGKNAMDVRYYDVFLYFVLIFFLILSFIGLNKIRKQKK